MKPDILSMLERMAATGTAPDEGVSLFSVGHDKAIERIRDVILTERFRRGGSDEKYVIGPFGSGKTHFLRQLQESARAVGCCTSEVALTKDVDFSDGLMTYREIARELRTPDGKRGIMRLLESVVAQVRSRYGEGPEGEKQLATWCKELSEADFRLDAFGRVAAKGLQAVITGNDLRLETACRWMGGDLDDKQVAKDLNVTAVTRQEQNHHARLALLSLFQLIRLAGFTGTVVCLDEAEQGLAVDKKKMERILSRLQSAINATADLQKGSALVVYAMTPDLRDQLMQYPALQQRVSDPGPGQGFHDGNTRATLIPLTRSPDPVADLTAIGRRLADLLYQLEGRHCSTALDAVYHHIDEVAAQVVADDITTSNRRTMVKRSCALLLHLHATGELGSSAPPPEPDDDEV